MPVTAKWWENFRLPTKSLSTLLVGRDGAFLLLGRGEVCQAHLEPQNMVHFLSDRLGISFPRFPNFLANLLFIPTSISTSSSFDVKQLLWNVFYGCPGDSERAVTSIQTNSVSVTLSGNCRQAKIVEHLWDWGCLRS